MDDFDPQDEGYSAVVRLDNPKMCQGCPFNNVEKAREIAIKYGKRTVICERRDCDNWLLDPLQLFIVHIPDEVLPSLD